MKIKEINQRSQTYDELIEYLKKSVVPKEQNINGELMQRHEDRIEQASKTKKALNFFNGMVVGIDSAIAFYSLTKMITEQDWTWITPMLSGGLWACFVLIDNYDRIKRNKTNTLDAKMKYAEFLQAMAESNLRRDYPFDASQESDFETIKEYLSRQIELGPDSYIDNSDVEFGIEEGEYQNMLSENTDTNDELFKGN